MITGRVQTLVRNCDATRRPLSCTHHWAAGFTLPEVCATLAIMGLLLAVALPAIQHVRATARRNECSQHMAQLGAAIANFESQYRRLPPGPPGPGARNTVEQGSPQVYILPFIEQRALYERLKSGYMRVGPQGDPRTLSAEYRPIVPLLLCPSDTSQDGANYRFNTGAHVTNYAAYYLDLPFGPTGLLPGRTLSQVTDGTSNTAIVSESLISHPDSGAFDVRADSWIGGLKSLPFELTRNNEVTIKLCAEAIADPNPYYPFAGWQWTIPSMVQSLYNHVLPPNAASPNCNSITTDGTVYNLEGPHGIHKASSRHPGGVNVLLLDGSLQFVGDSVDLGIWRAYGTCSGGETEL